MKIVGSNFHVIRIVRPHSYIYVTGSKNNAWGHLEFGKTIGNKATNTILSNVGIAVVLYDKNVNPIANHVGV